MEAIQRGIVVLIAMCWALTGCGGEAEDTREDEFGQVEQGITWPSGTNNVFPDNYNVIAKCAIGSENGVVCNGYSVGFGVGWVFSAINTLNQVQGPTLPKIQLAGSWAPSTSNSYDIFLSQSNAALGSGTFEWNKPEYFDLSATDASTTIPGTSARKRRFVTLVVNTNAMATKVAVSGVSQSTLLAAAYCRAVAALIGGDAVVAGTCSTGNSFDQGSFLTFSTTWAQGITNLPAAQINQEKQRMRDYDNFNNPDQFNGAPEL